MSKVNSSIYTGTSNVEQKVVVGSRRVHSHSRRKNRIAIVDNKIMMTKTTSSRSSSCSISSGSSNRKMSSVSFTSLDFSGEDFVDFVVDNGAAADLFVVVVASTSVATFAVLLLANVLTTFVGTA